MSSFFSKECTEAKSDEKPFIKTTTAEQREEIDHTSKNIHTAPVAAVDEDEAVRYMVKEAKISKSKVVAFYAALKKQERKYEAMRQGMKAVREATERLIRTQGWTDVMKATEESDEQPVRFSQREARKIQARATTLTQEIHEACKEGTLEA